MRYVSTVKCCVLVFGLMTVGGVTESHAQTCKANRNTPLRDKACGAQQGTLVQGTDLLLEGSKGNCPAPWARHWVEVGNIGWGSNLFRGWVAREYIDCPGDGQRLRKKSDAQLH
jgi:hypothetical protein